MAATVIAPRYSADDFETGSIRSAAPSYGTILTPPLQHPKNNNN